MLQGAGADSDLIAGYARLRQKIAEAGNTDSDVPKLHFEIRRQGKPIDPIKLLPER